jgi:hypothetical protein
MSLFWSFLSVFSSSFLVLFGKGFGSVSITYFGDSSTVVGPSSLFCSSFIVLADLLAGFDGALQSVVLPPVPGMSHFELLEFFVRSSIVLISS